MTLEGTVSQHSEREDAGRAVRYLSGVRGVTNKIIVSGQKVEPEEVRLMIEEALECRPERAAKRINVEIYGGTVALSGAVRSWGGKARYPGDC